MERVILPRMINHEKSRPERPSSRARWVLERPGVEGVFCADLGPDVPAIKLEHNYSLGKSPHPWALAIGEATRVTYRIEGRSVVYVVRRVEDSKKDSAGVGAKFSPDAAKAPRRDPNADVPVKPQREVLPGVDGVAVADADTDLSPGINREGAEKVVQLFDAAKGALAKARGRGPSTRKPKS